MEEADTGFSMQTIFRTGDSVTASPWVFLCKLENHAEASVLQTPTQAHERMVALEIFKGNLLR